MKIVIHSIFKTFLLSLLVMAQVHFAFAQTASILPPAKTTFFDANGNPLTAGTVDFYIPSTTSRKTTWQDAAETVPNLNPVVLDSAGRALILGSGSYRQVVKDKLGNLIWDQVTSSVGSGGSNSAAVGDGSNVGTILNWSGLVAPTNYVFAYGEELSRTTYSLLLTTITQNQNATCVSGNATLNTVADTSQLPVGAAVESSCLPINSVIVSKTSSTVTLNNTALVSTTVNTTFFPWGNGNGVTTFNVPDLRGTYLAGRNNMGGSTGPNLSNPTYTDPNALAGKGGNQTQTLNLSNLPTGITSSGTGTGTASTGTGRPNIPTSDVVITSAAGAPTGALVVPSATAGSWASVTSLPVAVSSVSVTSNNTAGAFFGIVPPSKTINYVIKVLPDTSLSLATISQLAPGIANQLAGTDNSGIWNTVSVPLGLTVSSLALNFNIPALTLKASPNASNDYVIIYDAAGNATKKATVGSVGSAGASGVTSIGGAVGGITLGAGLSVAGTTLDVSGAIDENNLNAISGTYPIVSTDCGKTILATGGSYVVTLPVVGGFNTQCTINLKNNQTYPGGRGLKLVGFPADVYNILYPQQALTVKIANGAWITTVNPGRWKNPTTVTWHVDKLNGSVTNDCLAITTGACLDAQQANTSAVYRSDTQGTTPIIAMACGQTHTTALNMGGTPLGTNLIQLSPDGNCAFTWTNSGPCIAIADLAELDINLTFYGGSGSVTFGCNTSNAAFTGAILLHNAVVLDLEGTPVWNPAGSNDNFLFCDGPCEYTIANGVTQATGAGGNYIINMSEGGKGTQSGTISASAAGGLTGIYYLFGNAFLNIGTASGGGWSVIGTSKIYGHSTIVTNGITPAGGFSVGATGVGCVSLTSSC